MGPQLDTHFVQYTAATGKTKRLTFRQRIGLVESSAIRELRGHIISNRERLQQEFQKADPDFSGKLCLVIITLIKYNNNNTPALDSTVNWKLYPLCFARFALKALIMF